MPTGSDTFSLISVNHESAYVMSDLGSQLPQQRTALITGASRGIGRAIALGLAQSGFDVILNDLDRQQEQLASVAAEIKVLGRNCFVCLW